MNIPLTDSKINLTDRILKNPKFVNNSNINTKLSENVIVYNNGREWKVIAYDIIVMYPIIHDIYFSNIKGESGITAQPITVVVCPYTLYSAVYFGEYISNNKIYNNNIVLADINEDGQILIPILNNVYDVTADKPLDKIIRKNEVKIMTLRNAISNYPDCLFINAKKIHKFDPIVPHDYLQSNHIYYGSPLFSKKMHPKTLIYIIEYKSSQEYEHSLKNTVIIPKKNNLDIDNNGFGKYFDEMINDIRDKGGMIYNCLWFAWISTYPKSKIIKL